MLVVVWVYVFVICFYYKCLDLFRKLEIYKVYSLKVRKFIRFSGLKVDV